MQDRAIVSILKKRAAEYPVVTVTGPRQSGKTTLCRFLYPKKKYFNLEAPDIREFAQKDPRGFLAECAQGAVIDEVQRVPELLSYIQVEVDERKKFGQFIITGSQNFQLLESISQSLAGRTAVLTLLPFSYRESGLARNISLEDVLYRGMYPPIHDRDLNPTEWLSNYVNTYIERDLRALLHVKDLSIFETFLKLCAGRTGQVLNYSSLGNDCGVNHNTVKSWISILEASYIVKLLRPYYKNFGKRLIKSPKLYFLDTGLAAYLLGIQNETQIKSHPLKGALFESFVVSEMLKNRFNSGKPDNLYFFRDHKGYEIDILCDNGQSIDIVEVKSGKTLNSDFFANLDFFKKMNPSTSSVSLVYGGEIQRTQNNAKIVAWNNAGTQ